jgi:hypothetical protein
MFPCSGINTESGSTVAKNAAVLWMGRGCFKSHDLASTKPARDIVLTRAICFRALEPQPVVFGAYLCVERTETNSLSRRK